MSDEAIGLIRTWGVGAIWLVWLLVVCGVGYARPRATDTIDHQATRVSVRSDIITLVSLALGVVAASATSSAALPWHPLVSIVLGLVLVAIGLIVRLWAARTLGDFFTRSVVIRDRQRIITVGPYRLVRHPAYLGLLISIVGLGLTLGSWLSVAIIATGSLLASVARIKAEEMALKAALGEQYCEYELTRKRLIPGVW
jgi:protein-S-isoprenylcysteine O-methyltransferase Ste14